MAQTITIANATYPDVPSIVCNKSGGGTAVFADPSGTTAAASDVAQGKYFLTSAGVLTQGTASGGGGSSYTLLGSQEFAVDTTSTNASSVGSIQCGSSAFTKAKIVYVRVRDKSGKRDGYFLGSDAFFVNANAISGSTSTYTNAMRAIYGVNSSGAFVLNFYTSSTGYGVYGYSIESSGQVNIRRRYGGSVSFTIKSTYVCEVYALDWPGNVSPFV